MAIEPYPIKVLRSSKWETVQTDALLPGDVVSIGESAVNRPHSALFQRH